MWISDAHQKDAPLVSCALNEACLRAEAQVCRVRSLFCLAIAGRFVWIHLNEVVPGALQRAGVTLPVTLSAVAFSVYVARRIQHKRGVPSALLLSSVLLDSVLCTADLISNILWPWRGYHGLLLLPDTMTMLLVLLAAGYRASPRRALAGALMTSAGFSGMVALDLERNAALVEYDAKALSMYSVMLGFAALLAVIVSLRTKRLVLAAAEDGRRSEQAKRGMTELLQEHHDAMGFLNAALFTARKVERADVPCMGDLCDDLERLRQAIAALKERALGDVVSLGRLQQVDIAQLLLRHARVFERLVAPMRVRWDIQPALPASVHGGPKVLERALLNLLVNAKEGNGVYGASSARVLLYELDGYIHLAIEDDGPGPLDPAAKPHGSGMGLRFVRAIARANHGSFELHCAGVGAVARLRLPVGEDSSARSLYE